MTCNINHHSCECSRRDFLRAGLGGLGVSAGLPAILEHTSLALAAEALADSEKYPDRILIVVELSGGNDGLSMLVPYNIDDYYRARPTLGIRKNQLRVIGDEFGFHPRGEGFERLFKDGKLAIAHGCGYPNPNLSHFSSMAYWHTGIPNQIESYGWLGRFADAANPTPKRQHIISVGKQEPLAVRSAKHAAITFSDPQKFEREGSESRRQAFAKMTEASETGNRTLKYLNEVSSVAADSSALIKQACADYRTTVDYGIGDLQRDLKYVAALIQARLPTRIYYVKLGGWDTHGGQELAYNGLLMYTSDALRAFMDDLRRSGRADDVAIMVFSEFGRRVKENASGGTDHGTAGPMLVIGNHVKGGHYGRFPSFSDLDENGNFKMTTDFRSVYATMMKEWMGFDNFGAVLKKEFPTLGIFRAV